ncbi:hypothetical protein Nepgr_033657 [Nepenthes gracilis]|uniref:Uncharacterized protein n=1 Tax=Nepenthes gracilis TaxID=150966 RepID=A0AAD3Y739_NEPGR|nr:hypothetical protein Nepgr_033657 [Nepenthes gracilis]
MQQHELIPQPSEDPFTPKTNPALALQQQQTVVETTSAEDGDPPHYCSCNNLLPTQQASAGHQHRDQKFHQRPTRRKQKTASAPFSCPNKTSCDCQSISSHIPKEKSAFLSIFQANWLTTQMPQNSKPSKASGRATPHNSLSLICQIYTPAFS